MTTRSALDLAVRADRTLGDLEGEALKALSSVLHTLEPGQKVEPSLGRFSVVAAGWTGLVRSVADGRRQILSTLLPGDLVVRRDDLAVRACEVVALSRVQLAAISDDHPAGHVVDVLKRRSSERLDSYVFDHVLRLGLLTAYERAGHFLLESHRRLDRVGLVTADQFLMPLSQEQLGELLGITSTHINRTFRQLRQDGFLVTGPGWLRLSKRDELATRGPLLKCGRRGVIGEVKRPSVFRRSRSARGRSGSAIGDNPRDIGRRAKHRTSRA